ncbi:MAG: hypothetical protein R3F54_26035 [Alphaproteobacteria bacterium]
MTKVMGVSSRTVQRVWQAHKPATVSEPSNARTILIMQLEDVVGLYMAPPAHALVLPMDEKSHVWMAPGLQEKS